MARIMLDEDVHRSLATLLTRYGHEVTRVQDEGRSGSRDEEIFDFAQAREAVLIAGDLGVADARLLSAVKHYGVVLLRMPNEMPTEVINSEIESLLPNLPLDDLTDKIVVIEPGSLRIRPTG